MGEAKRRKKLDLTYGKIPRGKACKEQLNQKLFEIHLSKLATIGYSRHGRGCLFLRADPAFLTNFAITVAETLVQPKFKVDPNKDKKIALC